MGENATILNTNIYEKREDKGRRTTDMSFNTGMPSPGPIWDTWLKLVGSEINLCFVSVSRSWNPNSLVLKDHLKTNYKNTAI